MRQILSTPIEILLAQCFDVQMQVIRFRIKVVQLI